MKLRKQLAALLAAGALGFAVVGTALAGGVEEDECDDRASFVVDALGVEEECEEESEEPTFEESEEPTFEETKEPESEAPSEPVLTEGPSEPVITEPPVTESPPPSFFQSEEGDTDVPSEPDTAAIGRSDQTGSPADGAWLLVVALGMLLASIVVLTPARARTKR